MVEDLDTQDIFLVVVNLQTQILSDVLDHFCNLPLVLIFWALQRPVLPSMSWAGCRRAPEHGRWQGTPPSQLQAF